MKRQHFLGSAELGKMAIDITRYAKTKMANYCLKNIPCEQGFLSGMAFNTYKVVCVACQSCKNQLLAAYKNMARVHKSTISRMPKYSAKHLDSQVSFEVFQTLRLYIGTSLQFWFTN